MAAAAPRFDRMVPAAPDAVGPLRRELRRWARRQGASPATQARVALAFSEACTNIIGAAPVPPPGEEPRPLMVQAWVDDDELGVRVSHPSRRASSPGSTAGHGFGLAIIARVCDRFEVRRRDERPGTAWLMTFRLARRPERSSPLPPSRSSLRR
jgi:anti-sigma regulatory factor (Ser/Thr protein kinase)